MSQAVINSFRVAAAAPTDPYFASVVALLHFEGANGSTTFTDVKGGTWTGSGGVALSNASVPFGATSCLFDGSDDLITSGSYAGVQFGTGDFTIECFMASTNGTVNYQTLIQSNNTQVEALIARGAGGVQRGVYYRNAVILGGSGTQALGVWKHVAYSRAAGVGHVFYDGIDGPSTVTDTVNYSSAGITRLGIPTAGLQNFSGYMKEMRITKGVARYTANFTPPSAPFPDS
jgi:Concanavalin A-like lectin/glucanases superfamily